MYLYTINYICHNIYFDVINPLEIYVCVCVCTCVVFHIKDYNFVMKHVIYVIRMRNARVMKMKINILKGYNIVEILISKHFNFNLPVVVKIRGIYHRN